MKNRKKILITGISGFAGSHLAEYISREAPQAELHGLVRPTSSLSSIEKFAARVKFHTGDLCDYTSLDAAITETQPDVVYHLAAQSIVNETIAGPIDTLGRNLAGTLNLFESLRQRAPESLVVFASSSNIYGPVGPEDMPLTEQSGINPASPYAVSKASADLMAGMYTRSFGLKVICIRAFNHIGPRRNPVFVDASVARQVARIEKGIQEPVIRIGNPSAIRSFVDVRDMVRAYELAVLKCKPGEVYNVGSEVGVSVGELVERLLAMSPRSTEIKVKEAPELSRKVDVPILVPDCSKFRAATGWIPEISFDDTLSEVLGYWRKEVERAPSR